MPYNIDIFAYASTCSIQTKVTTLCRCLRAHTPETGALLFTVPGAHASGVTSFALLTSSGLSNVIGLLTGGTNGQVRSWQVGHSYKTPLSKPLLKMTVKEHANDVVKIQVTKDLTEAISGT